MDCFSTAQLILQHYQAVFAPCCQYCMLVLLPVQQQLRLKTTSDRSPFAGKYKLQFWVYVGVTGWEGTSAKVPDININIGGNKVSTVATVGLMWMQQSPVTRAEFFTSSCNTRPVCIRLAHSAECWCCYGLPVECLMDPACPCRLVPDRAAVKCGGSTMSSRMPLSRCASTVPTTTGAGSECRFDWLQSA